MHGNSILVKITNNKYIHIGCEIYKFETNDEIVDYISPVGNADVSYPVAFGENNVYFMLDKKMIRINDFEMPVTVANAENLWKYHRHKKHNFKNVKMLQEK